VRSPTACALGLLSARRTYWRELVAEPSFIVINPTNGHAHYVYLLRGWIRIDGTDASELAAVRYFAAIERAYTRVLRGDAGYAGLVQHKSVQRELRDV
jgi:Replicase family